MVRHEWGRNRDSDPGHLWCRRSWYPTLATKTTTLTTRTKTCPRGPRETSRGWGTLGLRWVWIAKARAGTGFGWAPWFRGGFALQKQEQPQVLRLRSG